jgi:hypothetical protein
MRDNMLSLLSGALFAMGLVISAMIDPAKVRGFLDLFGNWDITLIFVMGGAIGVNLITFNFLFKKKPLCANEFSLPSKTNIDKNLILGSIMFGVGWGLIGICPGPGLVNLVTGDMGIVVFIISMIIGMKAFEKIYS